MSDKDLRSPEVLSETLNEYVQLCDRQSRLLTAAVNALKGDPPPLTTWSHHDVAGLARAMKDRAEKAEAELERVRGDLAKVLTDGIPTPTAEGSNELTGDLARDMAAYAMRLKDRLEKAEDAKAELGKMLVCATDGSVLKDRADESVLQQALAKGEASDGYHTHNELYTYRMLYNAALFNEWHRDNLRRGTGSSPRVCKSWFHSDGEPCFGSAGEWFIVVAELPNGQISNHYKAEYWDLFQIPVLSPPAYDGHTPQQAAQRLRSFLEERR